MSVSSPIITTESAPWIGPEAVSYTVQYGEGHFAFGVMDADVWAVWYAAGCPVNPEDAGLVWEGDTYGNYALPA